MPNVLSYFTSSIGKKYLMSITGLSWTLFVFTHMLGNMLIFAGPEAYNRYSYALTSNPLIIIAEIAFVATLLVHIITAVQLTLRNRKAKPQMYAVAPKGAKSASISSRTMIYTGSIVLAFTILHLITFKFGTVYFVEYKGLQMRDFYRLIVEVFQNPIYVAWYVVSVILVGVHLKHGFGSSFQSLGFNHPKYRPFVQIFGYFYALVVTLGFLSQPLYVFLMAR